MLSLLVLLSAPGCDDDFTPASVINRLRILGVRVDRPELCPFGPTHCPKDTSQDPVTVSILAADADGLVADGDHPGGPFLRPGIGLEWALCSYALRGLHVESPDCTQNDASLLASHEPRLELRIADLASPLSAGDSAPPGEGFAQKITIGAAVAASAVTGPDPREWGIKQLDLSTRPASQQNRNPTLTEVTLAGVPVVPGEAPFAEVETGHAYRIGWKIPHGSWQRFEVRKPDGVELRKERLVLYFWSTGGSFSKDSDVELWMASEEENKLYWRPPLEVPEEGQELTLFFNLLDQRGGSAWTWGRVRVVRGEATMPR
jgi:hypothetical protein